MGEAHLSTLRRQKTSRHRQQIWPDRASGFGFVKKQSNKRKDHKHLLLINVLIRQTDEGHLGRSVA